MSPAIYFYNSVGEFGWLVNFSRHSFVLQGKEWPSVEHYFQASKFSEESRAEEVRGCHTPNEAKRVAKRMDAYKRRLVRHTCRGDEVWD
jgi:N-glycosidase YbiA